MIKTKVSVVLLVFAAALAVGGAAAARNPTAAQKAAIIAALHSVQGDVAIQGITISTANPGYASMEWGFANDGRSALNNSLFIHAGSDWKVLWTRETEQSADGACVYVPAQVARDLLDVSCPPPSKLRAHAPTKRELAQIRAGFRSSTVTPYAKSSTGLARVCMSNANASWAAAAAGFSSGGTVFVFFQHQGKHWTPVFDSLLEQGTPPPTLVVLSVASCVGLNPADYDA